MSAMTLYSYQNNDGSVFVSVTTLDIYAHDYSNQDLPLMLQSTIKYLFSVFLYMCLLTGRNCFLTALVSSS